MTENEIKWNLDGVIKYLYKKNELGGDDSEKQYQVDSSTIDLLEELQQYREIGTVEECQEARERQRGKKPIIKSKKKTKIQTGDYVDVKCPCCEEDIFSCFHYPPWNDSQKSHKHCENCGQAISWEGEE